MSASAGGDLATWLRLHYPQTVAAAVASSAPLLCNTASWDATAFWQARWVPWPRRVAGRKATPRLPLHGRCGLLPPTAPSPLSPLVPPLLPAQVVTDTASPANGAAPGCVPNARAAFAALFSLADSQGGSETVEDALALCPGVLGSEGVEGVEGSTVDATIVATWLRGAFDVAAMGSFPSPSSYFTGAAS